MDWRGRIFKLEAQLGEAEQVLRAISGWTDQAILQGLATAESLRGQAADYFGRRDGIK